MLCVFNFEICDESLIVLKYNNCYSFNLGTNNHLIPTKVLKSKESGNFAGLNLHLSTKSTPTFESQGVTIFINNQSSGLSVKKGITVLAGMKTNLILSRNFQTKLGKPFSDCKKEIIFSSGPHAISNKTKFMYSQSECFKLCFYEKLFENCNKLNEFKEKIQYYYTNEIYFWKFYNKMIHNCSEKKLNETANLFTQQGENEICEASCPIECQTMSYSITINSQAIDPLLMDRLNYSKRMSIIEIYYNDFGYTSINEIPKTTFESLIGNVGGILGVFLGTSLISFVEIPELIYSIFYVFYVRKRKEKKENKKKRKKTSIKTVSSYV